MKSMKLAGILVASLTIASTTFAQRAIEMGRVAETKQIEAAKSAMKGFISGEKATAAEREFNAKLALVPNASTEDVMKIARDVAVKISTEGGQILALERSLRMEAAIEGAVAGKADASANSNEALALMKSTKGIGSTCSLKQRNFTSPEQVQAGNVFKEVQISAAELERVQKELGNDSKVIDGKVLDLDKATLLEWTRVDPEAVGKGILVLNRTITEAGRKAGERGCVGSCALAQERQAVHELVASSVEGTKEEKEKAADAFDRECRGAFAI